MYYVRTPKEFHYYTFKIRKNSGHITPGTCQKSNATTHYYPLENKPVSSRPIFYKPND